MVMVAEDPLVSKFVETLLGRFGYQVTSVSARRASEILRSGAEHPDVLITNHPEEFLAMADRVAVVYTAAYPDEQLASHFPHCRTLHKPFRNQELLEAVSGLVSVS